MRNALCWLLVYGLALITGGRAVGLCIDVQRIPMYGPIAHYTWILSVGKREWRRLAA